MGRASSESERQLACCGACCRRRRESADWTLAKPCPVAHRHSSSGIRCICKARDRQQRPHEMAGQVRGVQRHSLSPSRPWWTLRFTRMPFTSVISAAAPGAGTVPLSRQLHSRRRRCCRPLTLTALNRSPPPQEPHRTYKALVCEKLGQPTEPLGQPHGALKLQQLPVLPLTHPNAVRIKVAAASLNFADALQLQVKIEGDGRQADYCRARHKLRCGNAVAVDGLFSRPNARALTTTAGAVPGAPQAAVCARQRVQRHGGGVRAGCAHGQSGGQGAFVAVLQQGRSGHERQLTAPSVRRRAEWAIARHRVAWLFVARHATPHVWEPQRTSSPPFGACLSVCAGVRCHPGRSVCRGGGGARERGGQGKFHRD